MSPFDAIVDKFLLASGEFAKRLAVVRPGQWTSPTPCSEWDVRLLVNHATRGNLNYALLAGGGTAAEFMRLRNVDALGADPVTAYADSVRECAEAYSRPGALNRMLDYPLGPVTGEQALAVRTADAVIHTWDLARAVGADEQLAAGLVTWITCHVGEIYHGLIETPVASQTTHRLFAPPAGELPASATQQDRLLHLMGRRPLQTAT